MEFGRFFGRSRPVHEAVREQDHGTGRSIDQSHSCSPPGLIFSGFMFLISLAPFWHHGEKAQFHIRTDRMSIHHCSGVTSISTGIYRAEFWVGVCWTPDSGNSWTKDEIRCYRIIAWTKTVSSHQAVDFVQLALLYSAWGLRQSCGTLVRRSGLSFDGK